MYRSFLSLFLSLSFLSACSSNVPRVLNPGSGAQALELSPSPVELTNDTPVSSFTAQNDTPGLANLIDLHWRQAYHTYAGVVPLNMQPITATSNHNTATFDIADLLPYALDNNIQVFELYPDEWIQADSPEFTGFLGQAAHYKAALNNASLVLGVSP